ncbi:hypothetical protein [Brachybacterium sacelli]
MARVGGTRSARLRPEAAADVASRRTRQPTARDHRRAFGRIPRSAPRS